MVQSFAAHWTTIVYSVSFESPHHFSFASQEISNVLRFVCLSCSHKVPLYVNFTYIVEVQIFLVALNCTLCKKTPHSQSNNMSQGFSSFLLSFAFSQKYLRGDLIEFSNIVTWNTVLMLTKLFLKQRVFFQDLTSLVTSKYLSLNHIDNIERADLLIWVYLHSYGST